MSHWKATAAVRDLPDADLRTALTEAMEVLYLVAQALEVDVDNRGRSLALPEGGLLDAIKELHRQAEDAREEADSADQDRIEAEGKLEALLKTPSESIAATIFAERDAVIQERNVLITERDEALTRLAKVEPLIEAYSDQLALARRFVSAAEGAGVKVRHVRRVKTFKGSS